MSIILLKVFFSPEEVERIHQEFPQYTIIQDFDGQKKLTQNTWNQVEIIFSKSLIPEEIAKAPLLRWVHSPDAFLDQLSLADLRRRGNIVISSTKGQNTIQVGEFAIGAILAFSKNLFSWNKAPQNSTLWESKHRETMWTLKDKTFLQIGLGQIGTEISRCTRQLGLRIWGVQYNRSFHPHCHKTFPFQALHSLLPVADIVSISIPRDKTYHHRFHKLELELMKEDSILMIIGSGGIVDEEALASIAKSGKFRGVILDAFDESPLPRSSPLWGIPDVIITPEIATLPKSKERAAFSYFLYNLRQFVIGNYSEMKNIAYEENS